MAVINATRRPDGLWVAYAACDSVGATGAMFKVIDMAADTEASPDTYQRPYVFSLMVGAISECRTLEECVRALRKKTRGLAVPVSPCGTHRVTVSERTLVSAPVPQKVRILEYEIAGRGGISARMGAYGYALKGWLKQPFSFDSPHVREIDAAEYEMD
jgi:hypothetical protein